MEYEKAIFSVVFLYYSLPLAVSEGGIDNFTLGIGRCISCNQTRGLISTGPCPYHFIYLEFQIFIESKYSIYVITNNYHLMLDVE